MSFFSLQVWWVCQASPTSRPGRPAPISTLQLQETAAATITNTTMVRCHTTPTTLSSTSPLTPTTANTNSTNSTLLILSSTHLSPTRAIQDRLALLQVSYIFKSKCFLSRSGTNMSGYKSSGLGGAHWQLSVSSKREGGRERANKTWTTKYNQSDSWHIVFLKQCKSLPI